MPPQTIEPRVERLEQRVTELERLPDRVTAVESQIVRLRTEMHDEFSAVRGEIQETRLEMRALHAQVVERLIAVEKGLREEISTQIQETRIHMRVLHEEVIGRLATIQEEQAPNRRRGVKPKKK